jgi:hypothetical protein
VRSDHAPALTFELVSRLTDFRPFDLVIDEAAIHEYRRLTGDENQLYNKIVPPGFAAIFGRQGYLRDHQMPPGGVLLGQEIEWLCPLRPDQPFSVGARVISAQQSSDRRKVVIETVASDGGTTAARVKLIVGWPA